MLEVDELFEALTIKELKQQNIKTRTEIESKKEELRFLVGERYRDIIDAADTIFDMKACSNEISDSLKTINSICKKWNKTMNCKFVEINTVKDQANCDAQLRYSVAAQIKLLLNMSELIWNALENAHFSDAAMLYNVCRNMAIHSQLCYDKYKNEDFDMQLIFSRQWSSLQNLEETISVICRKYLKSYENKHNFANLLDCLVSMVILEDKSLEDVLKEYMDCVDFQIQEWFSPKAAMVPINVQLCSVASIIMRAVSSVHELFIEDQVVNRVEELSRIIVQHMDCVKGELIYQYLPEQISKFKPALKPYQSNCRGIVHDAIIRLTIEWLDRYRHKYQSDFANAFSHLTSLKSVGDTRRELKKIFVDPSNTSTSNNNWHEVESRNSVEWNGIMSDIYSQKLQIIIHECVSTLFDNWTKSIEKFINTNDTLICEDEFNEGIFFNYFWTECSKDVFFNSEYSPSSNASDCIQSETKVLFESLYNHFSNYFDMAPLNSNKNCNFELLVVKSKVIRPEIYQITKILNDSLLHLIVEIIDTVNDSDEFLSTVLHECLLSIVEKCLAWIRSSGIDDFSISPMTRDKFKKDKEFPHFKIESENFINNQQFRLIIVYQSLRSIYEAFPALQAGLMTSVLNSESSKTIDNDNKPSTKSKKSKTLRLPYLIGKRLQHQSEYENLMWTVWNDAIKPLKESADQFIICGIKPSITSLISHYFSHIETAFSSIDICEYLATKWTDMSLPNAESESSVPISLEVPNQCSWLMHRLLINISRLLTIFGGHSILRKNLDEIRLEILKSVIVHYELMTESEEFHENKTCQKQNIQLIFDLRFLLEIINAKTGIEKEVQDKLRSILTDIEKTVDPFDYQMMNECLHQNLIQNVAKTTSLYLLLSSNPSKRNMSTVQRIETGTNQHNLIDLVGSSGGKQSKNSVRFGMLPISGYMVPSKSTIPSTSLVVAKPIEPSSPVIVVQSEQSFKKPRVTNTTVNNSRNKNRTNYLGRLGSNWF